MAQTNTPTTVRVQASAASAVADFIRRSRLDGDDLIFTINRAFPGLSLRTFAAALALHRARSGAEGYALIFPSGGGMQ